MNSRLALPALLAAFVLLALGYSIAIPLGEAADEVPHYAYVQYLLAQQQLPTPTGAVLGESHQPPLYYFLGALATAWIPQAPFQVIANPDFAFDDRIVPNLLIHDARERFPYRAGALAWHLVRLLSIALGAVTIWSTWQIARHLFPVNLWIVFGAAAFVAFLPGFVLLSAVVNNDNLVIALSSLGVLQTLRAAQRGFPIGDAVLLGIILGLAVLSKLTGLVVWVFAASYWLITCRGENRWRKLAPSFLLCFGIAGVMILPWLVYNQLTFGDPLAWSIYLTIATPRPGPMSLGDWARLGLGLYTSFWGRFGGALQIYLPRIMYSALGLICIVPLVGWLRYARDVRQGRSDPARRTLLILLTLFGVPMLAVYARWSVGDLAAGQARLIFPWLPLIAIFLAAGLAGASKAWERINIASLSGALGALCIGTLIYIRAIYAN